MTEQSGSLGEIFSKYMSEEVTNYLASHETDREGAIVSGSILIAKIKNFNRLTQDMDPKQMAYLLNEHFTKMVSLIFQFGGRVDQYVNDTLVATFGFPIERPSHRLLAVAAAMSMRDALGLTKLDIAINSGQMFYGDIGHPERVHLTVVGKTVNQAWQMLDQTSRFTDDEGRILISQDTYQQVRQFVEARGYMGHVGTSEDYILFTEITHLKPVVDLSSLLDPQPIN